MAIAQDPRPQYEIAALVGKDSGELSRYKKGVEPGADVCERLVDVLGISGHWLLTGEGPMKPPDDADPLRLRVIGKVVDGQIDESTLRILASEPDEAEVARRAARIREIALGREQTPGESQGSTTDTRDGRPNGRRRGSET